MATTNPFDEDQYNRMKRTATLDALESPGVKTPSLPVGTDPFGRVPVDPQYGSGPPTGDARGRLQPVPMTNPPPEQPLNTTMPVPDPNTSAPLTPTIPIDAYFPPSAPPRPSTAAPTPPPLPSPAPPLATGTAPTTGAVSGGGLGGSNEARLDRVRQTVNPNAPRAEMEAALTNAFKDVPGFEQAYKESVKINGKWYDLVENYGAPGAKWGRFTEKGPEGGRGTRGGGAAGVAQGVGQALAPQSNLDQVLAEIQALAKGTESPLKRKALMDALMAGGVPPTPGAV